MTEKSEKNGKKELIQEKELNGGAIIALPLTTCHCAICCLTIQTSKLIELTPEEEAEFRVLLNLTNNRNKFQGGKLYFPPKPKVNFATRLINLIKGRKSYDSNS